MPWANTKKNRITSSSFNSSFLARPSRDRKHPGCAASPGLGARCGLLKHRTAIKSTRPLWCHVVRGTMYPMMAKYHCLQLLCSSQPGIQNTRVAAETYYIYLVHIWSMYIILRDSEFVVLDCDVVSQRSDQIVM